MSINVGVIGCGMISRFHFAGLQHAGAKVSWICDLDRKAAGTWVDKLGASYCEDYRRMLEDPQVQAVDILTISSTHKRMCLDAIEAGKAVICEKTLAENADDALEIVSRARQKGTIFYTSYMKRFIPAVMQAKRLLPSLGRIMSTHIRAYQRWGDLWTQPASGGLACSEGRPSLVRQRFGGGLLVCGGSHILDLVCHLLGRPRRLYATMHTPQGYDIEAQAAALLETDNGIVHYEALGHPLSRIGFLRDGWDERVEINGTGGRLEVYSAEWNQVEHKASLLVHYDNATQTSTEHRFEPCSPFTRALEFFCKNIVSGVQGEQSPLSGYDVDELIDHMYRSARSHQALDVNYRIS